MHMRYTHKISFVFEDTEYFHKLNSVFYIVNCNRMKGQQRNAIVAYYRSHIPLTLAFNQVTERLHFASPEHEADRQILAYIFSALLLV